MKAKFKDGSTGQIETSGVAINAYAVFFHKSGDEDDDWHRREFLNHAQLDKFLASLEPRNLLGVFALENNKATELDFYISNDKVVCEQVLSLENQPVAVFEQYKREICVKWATILLRRKGKFERVNLKQAAGLAVLEMFNRFSERNLARNYNIFIENSECDEFSYLVNKSQGSEIKEVFLFDPDKLDLNFVCICEAIERIALKKIPVGDIATTYLDGFAKQAVIRHEKNGSVTMKIEEIPRRSSRLSQYPERMSYLDAITRGW
ncbi:MAG: hypothetical protein WCP93_04575 [Candidatus Berkelbacteria bacterium]